MDKRALESRASAIIKIFTKDKVTHDNFIAELCVMIGAGLKTLKADRATKLKFVDDVNLHLINIVNDMDNEE